MDLNSVEMFVTVVQAGSLSAASGRTGIPLPTISRHLRALENQLGVQLLERSVRGVRLTDAGTRLYEHASRGIDAMVEAREAVIGGQREVKGFLRISLPPAFDAWWALLEAFQAAHPDIRLHADTTERRVDLTAEGFDVVLRVGAIEHESMVARRIINYRHLLVASPSLLEQHGVPVTPGDLLAMPCAMWSPAAHARPVWRLGATVIHPNPAFSANDYAHLRRRALSGCDVTELPPFLAAEDPRAGRLVALLDAYPLPEQELNLLFPSHRHPSSVLRAYLDFCQAYCKQHPLA